MGTSLGDLWRHRALVGVLTARELKARYRGSVFGFLWSLLNPLLMLVVYTAVFQLIFPSRNPATRPYALFLFCGLLPWQWLAASLTDASSSLLVNGSLLKKILFPAEVLPCVAVLSQAAHFLLALPVLLAGLLAGALGLFGTRVTLGWPLLQTPLLLLLQAFFLVGAGLFLAALTVHFRDMRDLLVTVLTLWFFATPVLYTPSDVGSAPLRRVLAFNPAAPFLSAWHDALFYAVWVPLRTWGVLLLLSLGFFLAGFAFFDRLRDSYAEAV